MAASKINIELLQDVAHLGRKGAIIEVSTSQARNSLIPKGIAREVTPERLKKIEADTKKAQDQARLRLEQAFEIQKQLDGQELEFTLKGKNGKIFGGLNEHEIGSKIQQKFGIHFEKQDIKLPNKTHIKTAGSHMIYLHITRDTHAKMIINVSIGE
jgi:large subunit ribosomal protein L9